MEEVIEEAKNPHLLNRCRYLRIDRFQLHLYLIGIVINLKRLTEKRLSDTTIGVRAARKSIYNTVFFKLSFTARDIFNINVFYIPADIKVDLATVPIKYVIFENMSILL